MNKDAIDEDAVRRAIHLNDLGGARLDAGDWEAALSLYQKAADTAPYYGPAWYNMGLIHKWLRDWPDSLACNERAARLISEGLSDDQGDEGSPAWWNLGIAATALHQWDKAREAWRRYGIEIPDGDGELELDFGPAPVRLDPDNSGEVVWGHRVDPARVVIKNVPTPSSGHHWGDIILHDGAPSGERQFGGQVYGVFDEIELWRPSGIPTLEVDVTVADADDSQALEQAFTEAGLAAEDWTANIRILCKQCSEGSPRDDHEHPAAPYSTDRRFGLAAPPDQARRLLFEWAATRPATRTYGDPVIAGD
jgi:tetratricopeptide (TPR) repeat protein